MTPPVPIRACAIVKVPDPLDPAPSKRPVSCVYAGGSNRLLTGSRTAQVRGQVSLLANGRRAYSGGKRPHRSCMANSFCFTRYAISPCSPPSVIRPPRPSPRPPGLCPIPRHPFSTSSLMSFRASHRWVSVGGRRTGFRKTRKSTPLFLAPVKTDATTSGPII